MTSLTERQQEVLDFIKLYAKKNGYPPTRKEIAIGFGWASANAAQQQLVSIESKGYIRLVRGGVSRGIVLIK